MGRSRLSRQYVLTPILRTVAEPLIAKLLKKKKNLLFFSQVSLQKKKKKKSFYSHILASYR
jgi:hypothetical protein